ncbi:MAG TPA: ankyrin repeat domain-containing protein [Blastocatellia bacterium]|nr:ankyrin repeat domain-containing protein [Blastocatellia bacterium]
MLKLRVICLLLILPLFAYAQDANEELLEAARKSDVEKVKALLAKGANVNAKSPYGVTPLGFACSRGSVEVVKVLLDHGAEVNVTDTFYRTTPFGMVTMGKKANPEIMRMLIEKGAKETDQALNYAITNNHPELAKTALAKGTFKQEVLDKALRNALKSNRTDIIAMLKNAGAKELPEFKVDAETLKKYEGAFKNPQFTLNFKVKDDKLTVTSDGFESPLLPLKEHTFEVERANGIVVTFTLEANQVTSLSWKTANGEVVLKKGDAK